MDIFEGENIIDCLQINISKIIGRVDVTNCSFFLDYINSSGIGDVIQLNEFAVTSINDSLLTFEIPLTNRFTYLNGKVTYWIRIVDPATSLIAVTAENTLTIKEHSSVIDYIPTQSLTLLDQWQVNMESTLTSAQEAITTAESARDDSILAKNASESARDVAVSYLSNPPIRGENGNWYHWNGTTYIDSGYPADGLSAYDSAILGGYVGAAEVFYTELASLQGLATALEGLL